MGTFSSSRLKPSQTYLNFSDEEKRGQHGISRKERKGRQDRFG
jgi:hypothetical protein